jgi:hypothetical protein
MATPSTLRRDIGTLNDSYTPPLSGDTMRPLAVQPNHKPEPPYLSDDMTKHDLVEVLQHLQWHGQHGTCLLRLDRGVRDFLLRLLGGR